MRSQKLPKQQKTQPPRTLVKRGILTGSLTVVALSLFAFTTLFTVPSAAAKEIQQLPHEPNSPKVLQVYFNTTDQHEYIYNGEEWVPHDASIDTYVLKKYKKPNVSKSPSNDDGAGNIKNSSNNQGAAK